MTDKVHPDMVDQMLISRIDNPKTGKSNILISIQFSTLDVADIVTNIINRALQEEGGLRLGGTDTGSVTIRASRIIEGSES